MESVTTPEKTQFIRAVVVDDQDMFVEALSLLLSQQEDIEVVATADSVASAVDAANRHSPDVMLMDYRLPDGSGAGAARQIRTANPSVKIIMLTGFQEENVLADCLAAGCSAFVTKQRAIQEVLSAVRATARGEAFLSPPMLTRLVGMVGRGVQRTTPALTKRQTELLELLSQGLSEKKIAERLGLSPHTVRNHMRTIVSKLKAKSKIEAVAMATREGLISSDSS